jgi:pimeloyl-ACP methyl ester carboxylesterase
LVNALRTPDENFNNLPDFPFKPHYIDDLRGYEALRMHYVDEGSKESKEVFLCLHGQPTWSYLYRKMIPIFISAGCRAVAPDFFGFGMSDKPVEEKVYTFDFHRNFLLEFILRLNLNNITLVCQDWGGLLGLTLPMDMPGRFSRLLIMNTTLGVGDVTLSKGFIIWRDWNNDHPDLEPGRLIASQCPLTEDEKKAYNAPFPDVRYKAGVRRFPNIVPENLDDPGAEISRRAREFFQNNWSGESFMAVGMQDPVLGPSVMRVLRKYIKGCPKPFKIKEAGHFVQEWGDQVAKKALEAFGLI